MDKKELEKYLDQGMSSRQIANLPNVDISYKTVLYWIHKYNLSNKMTYKLGGNIKLEKIDTKEKAYCLGFILGDGCVSNNNRTTVVTSLKDKEVVDFIANHLDANVTTSNKYDKKKRIFPRVTMSKSIKDITKFTGGRLKVERHFPKVRNDLERYLLQGFFDAEGCITWGRRKDRNRIWHKISFTSQYKMLEGVQQLLLKKLNISTKLRPKENEKCFVLEFANRKDVLKFLEYIYPNEDFIILNRKYEKYKALRLELEENGGSHVDGQYRAELTA